MDWQRQLIKLLNLPTSRNADMPATGLPMGLAGAPLATLARPMKEGLGALSNLAGVTGELARGGSVPRSTIDEAAIKSAASMADITTPGPSPGGTDIGMFMGRNAAHAPKPRIAQALNAAQFGNANVNDTWHAYEVDTTDLRRPRWEIADNASQLNEGLIRHLASQQDKFGKHATVTVKDAVEHPELFENYPALGRMPFELMLPGTHNRGQFSPGAYDHNNPTVAPGTLKLSRDLITPSGPLDTAWSTALHELQHGVQWLEGFPMGSNLQATGEQARKAVLAKLTDLYSQGRNADAEKLQGMWTKYASDPQTKAEVNFGLYRRSPGEVEARNTQERRWYSPPERAVTIPWQSADVKPTDVAHKVGFDPMVPWWENEYALNKPTRTP